MLLHKRLIDILDILLQQKIISLNTLMNIFNVTDRTIRNDINSLNSILKKYKLIIKSKRNKGYYLEIQDKELYKIFLEMLNKEKQNYQLLDSSEERIKYLLNILLYNDKYLNIDEISEILFVGTSTLKNYIKLLEPILEKYNLELIQKTNKGIKIIGNESDKRKCIFDNIISQNFQNYITTFTQEEYQIFDGIDLNKLKSIIYYNLQKYNIPMNDFNLKNLIIHSALMISRIKLDYYINFNIQIKITKNYQHFINSTTKELEEIFDIIVSEGEKMYLYSHLIANTHTENLHNDNFKINDIINNLLITIYNDYNFDLNNDEILIKDLLYHFKTILNTKYLNLDKRNPLLNTIKANFPLAFNITLTSITKIFSHLPYKLTEDEIGYISLHIGAAIERCFYGSLETKNVLLICGSGQATSRILETRLNQFFKDKINIIKILAYHEFLNLSKQNLNNIDFIISTVPIQETIIPSILVNFTLKDKDIESITKFLTQISSNKTKKSMRFFDKDLFLHLKTIQNKEILLNKMCSKLLEKNFVNNDFLNSVLERESISNTNMNEIFALPHPMSLCANETKVFVTILDKPIIWHKKNTVKIIFLLAINVNDQQHLEHLYDIFIEVINNNKLQHQILKSKSFDEFINTLENYL